MKTTPNIGTPSRSMASPSEFKYHFSGKEDAKKFFYVYENVVMKTNTEEEKEDSLMAYLDGEACEYYFDNFTEGNAPNEEARSFQKVKAALLDRFSTKKTEAEVMKEAVNLVYKGGNVKEFFLKASKLYKEAKFNDRAKFGLSREAIKSDQGMLEFVFLRKADTYEKVRETCLEYADNQRVFVSQEEQVTDQTRSGHQEGKKEKLHKETSEKVDTLCKKFEQLALLISKDKPKKNIQDITCHKCKKPGHYASQCQLVGNATQGCGYCGRYGHTEAACYKKQADEARSKADKSKANDSFPKTILKKEVEPEEEEKKKPIMFVQETETQKNEEEVLMKRMATGEPVQKHTRIAEPVHEDAGKVVGAARIRRRPTFTPMEPKKKKAFGNKKKDTRQKPAMQVLGERVERYDFLKSLACAPAGITFGQIANGDVGNVKKELQKIIAKKVKRTSVNVAGEGDWGPSPPNRHQVVEFAVYSEAVYGLLDSGAIPNVMSDKLANKLRLELSPTERRIIVADGTSGSCAGSISGIPVSFGSIVMRLDFLAIASVPYDLIIGAPTLVDMRACIDMYHQTVTIRSHGKTEVLNLVYEPEKWDGSDDELTIESESDIAEDSDKGDYSAFLLTLKEDLVHIAEIEEIDVTEEKVSHLPEEYAADIKWLFQSYRDVIAHSFDDVKPSKCKVPHKFEFISETPIAQKLRRLPPTYNEIVKKEVDRMLQAGIITPVESAWTSPIVLATKKDGSPIFCIDFRKLNAVMKSDKWPVPCVEEIFDDLRGSSIFTTLDLFQGYWQIKMDETCEEKTTFICKFGTYQFEVMPFGLKNSGATFQRMTDNILVNVTNVKCYVDDVIIHSATAESHVKHLENVFALLLKHGLRIRLKKCSFMQPRVELLGHCIDKEGIHTDEKNCRLFEMLTHQVSENS